MNKFLIASLAATLYVGGAAHGFAADKLTTVAKEEIVRRLVADGVAVESVEEWNGKIRAYVFDDQGKLTMRFYEKGSLRPAQ